MPTSSSSSPTPTSSLDSIIREQLTLRAAVDLCVARVKEIEAGDVLKLGPKLQVGPIHQGKRLVKKRETVSLLSLYRGTSITLTKLHDGQVPEQRLEDLFLGGLKTDW